MGDTIMTNIITNMANGHQTNKNLACNDLCSKNPRMLARLQNQEGEMNSESEGRARTHSSLAPGVARLRRQPSDFREP